MKKLFFCLIILFCFSSNSYSKNYKFTKIIELNEPWGSSFINKDELIINEKTFRDRGPRFVVKW